MIRFKSHWEEAEEKTLDKEENKKNQGRDIRTYTGTVKSLPFNEKTHLGE